MRSGMRRQKRLPNGGTVALPIIHEISPANMNMLRLKAGRGCGKAPIARDRIVDRAAHPAISPAGLTFGLCTGKA